MTCAVPVRGGGPCGRRTLGAWHPGLDVPACESHAPRGAPGQENPSPCCGLTMWPDGRRWRCPCGFNWTGG